MLSAPPPEEGRGCNQTFWLKLHGLIFRVFSRDILLAGGMVLGVYYLLDNIMHYYYCQSEWGEDSNQGGEESPPPLENTL